MVYDALVIGNGIAGSCTALFLARQGKSVCLVTKASSLDETNTARAQGGIVFRGERDTTDLLLADILRASSFSSCRKSARILARLGPVLVQRFLIEELHVPFERKKEGTWDLFQEGAHSLRRILHVKDYTGKAIQERLNEAVLKERNITLFPRTFALELITSLHLADFAFRYKPPECFGAYVLRGNEVIPIFARATVLATGGLNAIFRHSSGGPWCTGDGFALAWRAQATLVNMEYIQFHPTLLYSPGEPYAFLISEAVRGEGAVLLDREGKPFLEHFHPLGNLAPRDVVARAIFQTMKEEGTSHVFLDLSPLGAEKIRTAFPEIFEELRRRGFDVTREPVPVVPGAHFACGGVLSDSWGRTTVRRLYAVGEVACTGVHGTNRLASTSLLEGLVFAFRAARSIVSSEPPLAPPPLLPFPEQVGEPPEEHILMELRRVIQETMWEYVGLEREKAGLFRALDCLLEVKQNVLNLQQRHGVSAPLRELENMVDTALLVTRAALQNPLSFSTPLIRSGRAPSSPGGSQDGRS